MENPIKSREILLVFDTRDAIPNGEREEGFDGPRIDPITGKAIITDTCLKRIIRDYFLNVKQGDAERVLKRNSFDFYDPSLHDSQEVFLNDLGLGKEELSNYSPEDILRLIEEKFVDHRLFGSMNLIGNQLVSITGPVQFEISRSFNIPKILESSISSSMAGRAETGAGTLGKSYYLDYAIFLVHGIVKQALAKLSGMMVEDISRLYEGLWFGLKFQRTRTKFNQIPRLLFSIVFRDERKQIPGIRRSIQISNTNLGVKSKNHIELEVDALIDILQHNTAAIENLEIVEDPCVSYSFRGKKYQTFCEIVQSLQDFPIIVPIGF